MFVLIHLVSKFRLFFLKIMSNFESGTTPNATTPNNNITPNATKPNGTTPRGTKPNGTTPNLTRTFDGCNVI